MVLMTMLLLTASPLAPTALASAPAAAPAQESAADLRAADARLNTQYRATMALMKTHDASNAPDAQTGPSYQQALVTAQRAWIGFRDANCRAFGYEFRGGSAEGLAHRMCLIRMTQARMTELRDLATALSPI